jgi:hypothetical protein
MSSADVRPWYKQFWPWFLIALPLTAVIAASTCVYIAFKNEDAVVRDDWYQDGKSINKTMDREKRALALHLSANVAVDAVTGEVRVTLKSATPQNLPSLDLKFSHATDAARDQDIMLTRQPDGSYHGLLTRALKGRYYLDIENPQWKLSDSELFPQGPFDIVAGQ